MQRMEYLTIKNEVFLHDLDMKRWPRHVGHFIFKGSVCASFLTLCVKVFLKDWQKSLIVAVDIRTEEGRIFKINSTLFNFSYLDV